MGRLARAQVSGGFPVSANSPGTILARIPATAEQPADLSVFNTHQTAVLYLKWIPINQTNQNYQTGDAGIVLSPGRSYTWDNPRRGAMLIALSTVDQSVAAVDGAWAIPEDAQLL